MKRRGFFWAAALISLVVSAGLLSGPVSAAEKTKLRFAECWILTAQYLPTIVAAAKGFYAEEGLDVPVERGFGSGDNFKRVAAGSLDVACSSMAGVVVGRAAGAKAKVALVTMHTPPFGLAYRKGAGIQTPKDLEGKKVAIPGGSSILQLWPAFTKATGIDPQKVQVLNLEPAVLAPSLAAGAVDAADSWLTSLPAFLRAGEAKGEGIGFFLFSDYGLRDLYGAVMVAQDAMITSRPQDLRGFVRATLRGLAYALENREESLGFVGKLVPAADPKQFGVQWDYTLPLFFDEYFEKNGMGFAEEKKVRAGLEMMKTYMGLKGEVQPGETYTNQFVEGVPREWRFPKKPPLIK